MAAVVHSTGAMIHATFWGQRTRGPPFWLALQLCELVVSDSAVLAWARVHRQVIVTCAVCRERLASATRNAHVSRRSFANSNGL